MRYQPTHAAPSGTVPFMLRGPKSLRAVLSAAVAGAIGLTPAIMFASPAQADPIAGYTLTPSSVQMTEGGSVQFTLTRAGGGSDELEEQTLYWSLDAGSAPGTDSDDFTATSGEVTFPADTTAPFASQTQKITVQAADDHLFEDTENFTLTVADAATGTPDTLTSDGGIVDNDEAPGYSLVFDDATPDESSGNVLVSAELDAPSGKDVTIPISTKNGTAISPRDYTALGSGVELTIPAGSTTSAPEEIAITDDEVYEEKEQTFTVTGAADDSVSGTETGTVTIQDDDVQPEVTIASAMATEGSSLSFDVNLSGPSEREVTARWDTADGPGSDLTAADTEDHGIAKAGSDYTATSGGTVKFPASTVAELLIPDVNTAQTITVRTTNDAIDEIQPEDMHVTLSSPTVAKLGEAAVGTGGINDNDDQPDVELLPSGTTLTESNARKSQTYTVRLSGASGRRITVNYATRADSAIEGEDYVGAFGTLTFEPGETTKTFTVDLVGDTMHESTEAFDIELDSSTATVSLGEASTSITVRDDDAAPSFTVAPISMQEGSAGSVAVFPIKLSNPTDVQVEFGVTVDSDSTATTGPAVGPIRPGDVDYVEPSGTAVIPAGQTTGYLYFLVNGDDVYEPSETVLVALDPDDGVLASDAAKNAQLTILNDDAAPTLTILPMSSSEGDDVQIRGLVSGIAQEDTNLSVTVRGGAVSGSRAASSSDFVDPGTISVTIPGGEFPGTSRAVGLPVEIVDDTDAEPAETIVVSGTGFGGAGTVTDGVITIAASDGGTTPPTDPTDPGDPDSITLAGPPYRVGPGPIRLTGTTDPNTAIQLWSAPYNGGADDWTEDGAEATSSSTGTFVFNRELTTAGRKYVVHAGATVSDEVQVALRQAPVLSVTSPVAGVAYAKVTGGIPRAKFLIQRRNLNGTWSTAFTGNLLSNGAYNQRLTGQVSGRTITFRAYVYGNSATGVQSAASAARQVRIR